MPRHRATGVVESDLAQTKFNGAIQSPRTEPDTVMPSWDMGRVKTNK